MSNEKKKDKPETDNPKAQAALEKARKENPDAKIVRLPMSAVAGEKFTEGPAQEVPEINKEQANQAFQVIVEAIDAAMTGKFPVGITNVEKHMMIKSSVNVIGAVMKKHYGVDTKPKDESDFAPDQTQPKE